jgi:ABC-type multidrug transport system ATPase subunit
MTNSQKNLNHAKLESIDEIYLDNVTLKQFGRDPVLQSVDLSLPVDQTVVIESSKPQNAVCFLQFLAGRATCESGQLLWNGQSIFFGEQELDPQTVLSSYFENHFIDKNVTIENFFVDHQIEDEGYDFVEMFELENLLQHKLKDLSYDLQKTLFLVKSALSEAQILTLEDPAVGLSEFNWLQFLDLLQYRQRRGYLRHVYMTNNHPTALRHFAYNKIFLEDGLIYFDENAGYKKASHF